MTERQTYLAYGRGTIQEPKTSEKRMYPPIVMTKEVLLKYGLVAMAKAIDEGVVFTVTYSDDEE